MADSPRIRRKHTRRRQVHSCTECRIRKIKCDRAKPCGQCVANQTGSSCAYHEPRPGPSSTHQPLEARSSEHESRRISRTAENSHDIEDPPDTPPTANRIHGMMSKTRVFGQGHWMDAFLQLQRHPVLDPIGEIFKKTFATEGSDRTKKVMECKRLARMIKAQRPRRCQIAPQFCDSFPDHRVMLALVELYLTTFDCCFRIVDRESFLENFAKHRDGLGTSEPSFFLQLALVMTISGPLHPNPTICDEISRKAEEWTHVAQMWLSAPFEKNRLSVPGIQIHCLLLLSRQVNKIGADLVWISAGSLIRMAMQMGFHQDPDRLAIADMKKKELRRRLWYTILELNAHAALDAGMVPMIDEGDYNTQPPSETVEGEDNESNPSYSQLSFQPLLAGSIALRLRIIKTINNMQGETSYDNILALSNKMNEAFCQVSTALTKNTDKKTNCATWIFASSFCSHLLQRFSLCLHFRYAIQAQGNPLQSYSMKACLDASLNIVALLGDELYSRVLVNGGGMFRDIITRCGIIIFMELNPKPGVSASIFAKQRSRAHQEPLVEDARRVVQYAKDRVSHGDMNLKTYVSFATMMAQVEARLNGADPETHMLESADESINLCHSILQTMATETAQYTPNFELDPQVSSHSVPSSGDLDLGFEPWDDNDFGFELPDFYYNSYQP